LITLGNNLKATGKVLKFLVFLSIFALLIAALIYWREDSVRDQISFLHVFIWQYSIWIPWILAFLLFKFVVNKFRHLKIGKIVVFGSGVIWIGIHFAWFFYISSIFSPYLGMPATGYGVYPYFFIFWTILDIGLMWYVLEDFWQLPIEDKQVKPILIELTRGDKKYYCEPNQVHWLSAEDYYTQLFTNQGKFLIRKTLKDFYKILPHEDFKRIHRSTVINVNYVSGLARGKNDSLEVILKDGTKRRVSRNYSREIRAFFRNWSQ